MLRATLYQQSLLEVDPDEIDLPLHSFERQLRDLVPRLFSVDDFLIGNGSRNELDGGRGRDVIRGGGNADRIYGDKGRDKMRGGAGDDRIQDDYGSDRFWGGMGDDRLEDSFKNGEHGSDRMDGGPGDDVCRRGERNRHCERT